MEMTETNGNAATGTESPEADRSRWIALYVLCAGVLMIVLDATVVNVALPAIQSDLGFSQSSLAWVVNAYLIAFGGLLLLAGRLGDLISRLDVFLAGLAVFTAASLVCGFAQSQAMIVAARFVQGIGGAMTAAVVLGMIVTMFPQPREQAKAIGVYAFVASAGGSVGLLAGGVLTQAISWHWIFFINIPIGLFTAVASMRLLERDRGPGFGHGADVLGAILITASLMLGVYTIVEPAAKDGWGDATTLALSAASLALLVAFVVRESVARNPLVPLRIFRSRNVAGANLIQALTVAGMFGMFFLGVLYLQEVLGYDALETGLAFLPTTLVMGTLSVRYAEPLIMRFGARRTLLPGLLLIAIGLALFATVPGPRLLCRGRAAADAAARPRRRGQLPGADDAGDVGRDPRGRRARLGAGQHDRPGRGGDRPRRAGDAVGEPHRRPPRAGRLDAGRPHRRLRARLRGGGRSRRGGARRGAGSPRAGAAARQRGRGRGGPGGAAGRRAGTGLLGGRLTVGPSNRFAQRCERSPISASNVRVSSASTSARVARP